jgi:outer membrane receptor protein involved in Fe transport
MLKKLLFVSIACLIVLCGLHAVNALADESPESGDAGGQKKNVRAAHLDEVVEVTADSVKTTLLDTPSTINILTSEDIDNSGQRELTGIINSIPGVLDDGSGSTYFSFRGTRSTSSEGAAIYIDGKPLNVGKFDYSMIDDIPLDIVERVEVVKSPAATRYGASSSRGVINIVTKSGRQADKPLQTKFSLDIGSWDSYKGFATVLGKVERWDYSMQFGRDQSEGYRHTDGERTMFDDRVGFQIADGIRLDGNFAWTESFKKNAAGLKYWSLNDRTQIDPPNSETGSTYRKRPNETDRGLRTGGVAFKVDRSNWIFSTQIDYNHHDEGYKYLQYYNNPGNGTTQRGQGTYYEDRNEDKANFRTTAGRAFSLGEKAYSTFTAGYDFSHMGWYQEREYPFATSLSSSRITEIKRNDIDFTRKIHGVFINNNLKYKRFGLYLGLRKDLVNYDYSNQAPSQQTRVFRELSWDVAPSLSITSNSNLYFSLGRSFWYPNAFYLQYAVQYNDPENQPDDLKPEEYLNYEAGFKQRVHKNLNYSFSFYRTEIENKYMTFYNSEGAFGGYKHVGKSIHQGIEFEADGTPLRWFGYRFGFTYIDAAWDRANARVTVWGETPAQDKTQSVDLAGRKLNRVPNYQYSTSLYFNPISRLFFAVDIHGFGKQYIDALNRYEDEAVNLLDLKVGFNITKDFEISILGSNLLDRKYSSIFNTAGDRASNGIPDHDYYPKDGRYVQGGFKMRF